MQQQLEQFENQLPDCEIHNRQLEVFSIEGKQMICPSCLMYGKFKGHNVISQQEAVIYMRQQLNSIAKEGYLKTEYCDNTLLDIRQNKLQFQESQAKLTEEVDKYFNDITNTLKARKRKVISDINQQFQVQIDQLECQENKWMKKEEITQSLIEFTKNDNDVQILLNSQTILDNIADLKQQKEYQKVVLLKNIFAVLQLGQETLGISQLQKAIDTFIQQGETINIQYRS